MAVASHDSSALVRFVQRPSFELVAPLIGFLYLHYAFFSVYAADYLTRASFASHHAEGIYRYRVLGKWLVLAVYDAMPDRFRDVLSHQPEYIANRVPQFDMSVYTTMVAVNFIAFAALVVIGRHLLRSRVPGGYQPLYWMLLGWLLLSSAIVTPYDFLAYFFLVATIAALEWRRSVYAYPALVVLTVLGALTRETQALVIPYAIATLVAAAPGRSRVIVPRALVVAATFMATYVALRADLGWRQGLFQNITLESNVSALSVFGLVVAALMITLIHLTAVRCAPGAHLRRRLIVLHVAALPYWATVIFAGFYFELRLFIPLALIHAAAIVNQSERRPRESGGMPAFDAVPAVV